MASKYAVLTQESDPADYCRIYRGLTAYDITALDIPTHVFYVVENIAYQLLDGSTFTIAGSTGNDGAYTVNGDSSWTGAATKITVDETISDVTDDGTIGIIWTNADDVLFDVTNISAVKLWTDANDVVYIGKDETFGFVGYSVATAPVGYGAFTIEYSIAGPGYATLSVFDNNTSLFTVSGFLDWYIPSAWTATTENGQSAYWIKASQTAVSPGTAAEVYHLLPNITLNPPIILDSTSLIDGEGLYHYDINNTLRKTDHGDKRPRKLIIDCTHLAATMMELNLLRYWDEYSKRVYVKDLSQTSPVALETDSYFFTYSGYLNPLPGNIQSPSKMDAETYQLGFRIDTITTIMDTLSITT